jgi:hypothetical protein
VSLALAAGAPAAAAGVSVTTFHYDSNRTGWNSEEATLTPANVGSSSFHLLGAVPLDGQVDAQPLLVSHQLVSAGPSPGYHDMLYVATENDTVYGIDAKKGKILLKRTLGTPVPQGALPGGCGNNAPIVGIDSTPVIDTSSSTLYVMAYTYRNQQQAYWLHALSLADLSDEATVPVTASAQLTDSSTYTFNAAVSRQRSALLEANGTIYAGFASFCDIAADQSRGWLLGWNASTLAPLAANELTNKLATDPDTFFLGSIWMSGAGPATDSAGNVYVVTGNADPNTYDGVNAIQESLVKLAPDLSRVVDLFTPYDVSELDGGDGDFGSGGVLVLPRRPGPYHDVAVAAGKDSNMYLVNTDNMGGYNGPNGPNLNLQTVQIGGCWCGESYFEGSDGVGRIVSSGNSSPAIWIIANGHLDLERTLPGLATGQSPGFFTAVSSNGMTKGTQIVWAVGRPTGNPPYVTLYAFDPNGGRELFSGRAGTWPYTGGDANIAPVVANGRVYVASYARLAIFGLSGQDERVGSGTDFAYASPALLALAPGEHDVYGSIVSLKRGTFALRTRAGRTLLVDGRAAWRHHQSAVLYVDRRVEVRGTFGKGGTLTAQTILSAKDSAALWPPDR